MTIRYMIEAVSPAGEMLTQVPLEAYMEGRERVEFGIENVVFAADRRTAIAMKRRLFRSLAGWTFEIFEIPDPDGDWGEPFLRNAMLDDDRFQPSADGETRVLRAPKRLPKPVSLKQRRPAGTSRRRASA